MYRLTRSPPETDTNSSSDDYEDSNSIDEVEATLRNLDDELHDTEQAVSTWSSSSSNGPGQPQSSYSSTGYGTYTGTGTYSYTATPTGFSGSQSFTSLPSLLATHSSNSTTTQNPRQYPPTSNDPRIRLSHITERTERTESRPVSGVSSHATVVPTRPRSALLPRSPGGHGRPSLDPGQGRDLPPPGRTNELIGLFEATSSGSRSRSTSPTKQTARSQTPTTTYSTLMSPPLRPSTATGTYTSTGFTPLTLSSSAFTPTITQTGTATGTYTATETGSPERTPASTLRRPQQSSPRSPLASVRNIVALWKERTPTKSRPRGTSVSSGSVSPTPESRQHPRSETAPAAAEGSTRPEGNEGLFGLRRRASGRSVEGQDERRSRASGSSIGIDVSELSGFLGGNSGETPLHLGNLYYLNVHTAPPFIWQRCQALLYRNTLLLSWLAPTSSAERAPMGRAVVQLDLMNCLTVESALSLSHPRARDDVGAITARQQDSRRTATDSEGLIDSLVPFWMIYGDGVERLACESLVERQRWIGRIWEAINNPPTPTLTPSYTRSRSPTGSIRTIMSVESRSSASTASSSASAGSRSTVFVPAMADIPEMTGIDDFYASESDRSGRGSPSKTSSSSSRKYVSFSDDSESGVRRRPSVFMSSYHDRTVDDTVISGDDYIYPGDSRAITGRRSSTRLRRSGSMTDIGSDFQTNRRYIGSSSEEEDERFVTADSSTPRSSRYSSAASYDSRTRSYTDTFTRTGTYAETGPYTSIRYVTPSRSTGVTEITGYTGYTRSDVVTGTGTWTDSRSGTGTWTGSGGRTVTGFTTSDTRAAPSTLSYRGTESVSMLGDSHDSGTYTGSPYTRTTTFTGSPYTNTNSLSYTSSPYTRSISPYSSSTPYTYTPTTTTTSLSRTREVRRRTRTSSYSHSSSGKSGTGSASGSGYQPSGSDETSDKENEGSLSGGLRVDGESHTGSGSTGPLSRTRSSETGYDICPSSDLSELTGRTITYSSTSLTMDSTPPASIPPSSSSERDSGDENFITAPSASEYASARSPSIASFESLPSIPSLYSTASEGSTRYRTASEPSTTRSTQYQTADICPSEIGVIPSEEGTPRASEIGLPPESEGEREVTPSEVPLPSVVPSIASSPSSISISSPSTVSSVRAEDIPLPESVASESDLDISPSPSSVTSLPLPPPSTESSILLTLSPSLPSVSLPPESTEVQSSIEFTESDESVAPPESTEPPMTSVVLTPTPTPTEPSSSSISPSQPSSSSSSETQSLQLPSLVPTTTVSMRTSFSTESSLTPTVLTTRPESTHRAESPLPPSPRWASETNVSFESSQLEPSPSIRSIALQEGPDVSFETSFLRATASQSSIGRMSTIPGTPTVTTTSTPSTRWRFELSPVLPSPPSLDLSSEVPTPTSLVFSESSSGMTRSPSTSSRSSGTSVSSSVSTSSWIVEPERPRELEDEEAMRMSQISTEPSLLSTPRASRVGSVVSDQSLSTITPSASISVSISTPQGDRPSTRSTLWTIPSQQSPFLRSPSSPLPYEDERHADPGAPAAPGLDIPRDLNLLIEEVRRYDQNRGVENRDMGHTLHDLQNELRNISELLHRPQTHFAEERVGRSTPSTTSHLDVPVYDDLTLAAPGHTQLSRATSSVSSISFLSSHHSEDWELYGRPDSPIPSFSESDGSSSSSSSSSFSSSAPSPSTLSDSLGPPVSTSATPTPPPLSSSSTSRSVSTIRGVPPSGPNPIPLLNEIRDQVRALWDGQLSTNHILDQLRERPTMADNMPLWERLNRVEELLRQLTEQLRQPPPPPVTMPIPQPVVPEPDDAETVSSLDIDTILQNWSRTHPTIAPLPRQQARTGPTLAEQLDALINQAERPTGPAVQHPEAVRSIRSLSIIVPVQGTPSPPLGEVRMPPHEPFTIERVHTEPPPHAHMRRPHPADRTRARGQQSQMEGQPPRQGPLQQQQQQFPQQQLDSPTMEMGDRRHEDASTRPRHDLPPPQLLPLPGTEAGRRTAPPNLGAGPPSPHGQSWYRERQQRPQGPPVVPGGVPPPGEFSNVPGQQHQQQPGGQASIYVPMPPGPVVVPGLDRLIEQNDAIREVILTNGAQTDELLRYMRDLNGWLERDVQDRQNELRGVLAHINALREQMGDLHRGRPMTDEDRSSSSGISTEEGTPRLAAPIPSIPGYPPGFVPHQGAAGEPPVIPMGGTGVPHPQEGPVIPGVVPPQLQTHFGIPPAPIVLQQPPGRVPVIPMDGFASRPGMNMPEPSVAPPGQPTVFIPPAYTGPVSDIPVVHMAGTSGSSSSSSSSPRTRSYRSHSRRPSSRSRRSRSRSSRTHSPETILPMRPPHGPSPQIVTVPVPTTTIPHPGSPRHPDIPGTATPAPASAAPPVVINIPPQPGGMMPGGMMPAPGMVPTMSGYPQPQPQTVVIRSGRSSRSSSRSSTSGRRSRSPAHVVVHTTPSRRSGRSGRSSRRRSRSRSRSRSPHIIMQGQPMQVPATVVQVPTAVPSHRRGRSYSRSSRSSRSRTPIIMPATGSHYSQGVPIPVPAQQQPTVVVQPGQPPLPMQGPVILPSHSHYGERPRSRHSYRSRSSRSSRSRSPHVVVVGSQAGTQQPHPTVMPTSYPPGTFQQQPTVMIPGTSVPQGMMPPPHATTIIAPGSPRSYHSPYHSRGPSHRSSGVRSRHSRSYSPRHSRYSRTPPRSRHGRESHRRYSYSRTPSYDRDRSHRRGRHRAGRPRSMSRSVSYDSRDPSHRPRGERGRRRPGRSRSRSVDEGDRGRRHPERSRSRSVDEGGRRRHRYPGRSRSRSVDEGGRGRRHPERSRSRSVDEGGRGRRHPERSHSRSVDDGGRGRRTTPSLTYGRYEGASASPRSGRSRVSGGQRSTVHPVHTPSGRAATGRGRSPTLSRDQVATPIEFEDHNLPAGVPSVHPTHPEDYEPRHSLYGEGQPVTRYPSQAASRAGTHAAPTVGTDYEPRHPIYDEGQPVTRHPSQAASRAGTHAPPPISRVSTVRTHPPTISRPGSRAGTLPPDIYDDAARSDLEEVHGVPHVSHAAHPIHAIPSTHTAPSTHAPRTPRTPRTSVTPIGGIRPDHEAEERLARMDDMERQLQRVAEDAEHAEDSREHQFRDHEEDRQRIFTGNEARRDELAAEARQALMDQAAQLMPPPEAEPLPVPPPISSIPVVRPYGEGEAEHLSDRASTIMEVASRHGREIREIIDMEREEMAREREAHAAERARLEDEVRVARVTAEEATHARITDLEEELARVRAELENERQRQEEERRQREIDEADLRERQNAEQEERDEGIRAQLGDITNLVSEQRALHDEKRRMMEEQQDEKRERRAKKDEDTLNLIAMMNKMQEDMQRDRERAEEIRMADADKPGFEQMIAELQKQNAEQKELLERLSNEWREDCERHHQETLDAVRSTADEQIPFNVQGYLDEFSKALATEVRTLLGEVGKLREERRGLQHEIGYLLCIRSKYGPGGEFEPDWKPQPGQPGGPPLEPPAPPAHSEQPPPPEPARPAWRNVYPRRSRKKKEAAAAPAPAPPQPDPRAQAHSWVQWHPDSLYAPTPPSHEPSTLLVPESSSPGLFGPRSPRSSRHVG